MLTPFDQMISEAVLADDPNADAEHITRTIAGITSDPSWRDLQFLTPALASGSLAVALAARAVAISTALKSAAATPASTTPSAMDAKTLAARLGMSEIEFSRLPPAKRRELHEAFAERETQKQKVDADIAGLKAKAEAGTISPTERLTLARLTEEPTPTKAQRRDPRFIAAQESRASLKTLRETKRGHDLTAASGSYPPQYRQMHAAHSERIGKIIAEREAAGEAG